MTAPTNTHAVAARLDEMQRTLAGLYKELELIRRLLFPPEVPSTVDGHKIGARNV